MFARDVTNIEKTCHDRMPLCTNVMALFFSKRVDPAFRFMLSQRKTSCRDTGSPSHEYACM